MKPSTDTAQSHAQIAPTSTTDVKTAAIPDGCSAVMISVEAVDARITFDGTAPASTNGLVFPKDVAPVLVPVGTGQIKAVSTSSSTSTVDLLFLA